MLGLSWCVKNKNWSWEEDGVVLYYDLSPLNIYFLGAGLGNEDEKK